MVKHHYSTTQLHVYIQYWTILKGYSNISIYYVCMCMCVHGLKILLLSCINICWFIVQLIKKRCCLNGVYMLCYIW